MSTSPQSSGSREAKLEQVSVERFWKLNALGNNFVFTIHDDRVDYVQLARKVCAIATSIGGDGLLTVDLECSPPMVRMWNPDGTVDFCANGLCSAAHLLCFLGHHPLDALDTPIRRVPVKVQWDNRSASLVTVGLERGTFDPHLIPLALEHATIASRGYDISVADEVVRLYSVNNGNMHSVIIVDQLPCDEKFLRIGPLIENHPLFPYRTNVLWCALDGREVRMRVWERGVGETLSCGTGSAAAFSVFERLGLLIGSSLSVLTTGGVSEVNAENEGLSLTTRVRMTFEGSMIDEVA
jgi:diaminopimelate epimerase